MRRSIPDRGGLSKGSAIVNDFCIFTTRSGGKYLYDANTNTTHAVPDAVDQALMQRVYDADSDGEIGRLLSGTTELDAFRRYVALWRRTTSAFASHVPRSSVRVRSMAETQRRMAHTALHQDLVLVVTEECNMRCAYCVYAEGLYPTRRTHRNVHMDFETARKAIDLYFSLNREERFRPFRHRALNIAFYGGEALLNREVVVGGIKHARAAYTGASELHLGVSTNLTLFDPGMLPFFVENEVFLNVSLDGPAEEHDRYRRFADGRPTFAVVQEKLDAIRGFSPEYYEKYVSALITVNGNTDLEAIADFFETFPGAPKIQIVSLLKDMENSEFHRRFPFDRERLQASSSALHARYEALCRKGVPLLKGTVHYAFNHDFQSSFFGSPHSVSAEKTWYTGCCLPGRKLAVTPDGNIHICERTGVERPVGHVDRGFDEEETVRFFNDFIDAAPDCPRCFARQRCSLCPAEVDCGRGFDFGDKCEKTRAALVKSFIDHFTLLEQKPDMFADVYSFY